MVMSILTELYRRAGYLIIDAMRERRIPDEWGILYCLSLTVDELPHLGDHD